MNATQTKRHLFCYITKFTLKEPRSCAILSKVDSDLGYTTCVVERSNKSRKDVEKLSKEWDVLLLKTFLPAVWEKLN